MVSPAYFRQSSGLMGRGLVRHAPRSRNDLPLGKTRRFLRVHLAPPMLLRVADPRSGIWEHALKIHTKEGSATGFARV
jgi:hypothetical protein